MRSHVLAVAISLGLGCATALAQPVVPLVEAEGAGDRSSALSEVLMIGQVLEVMRTEGIASAGAMADEMFPGRGGPGWLATVGSVYDAEKMRRRFDAGFTAALAGSSEVEAIETFFGSELGRRTLTLEIEARRALLEPAVEAAASEAFADMETKDAARVAMLREFVETNDLIESNVMGAMNARLAFYQGMAEVDLTGEAMPEEQILAEVWAQEPDVRAETVDWLYPYLALAYKPLSDAELQGYLDFSDSSAGQVVNAALFAAFDAIFVEAARDLGRAAARQMKGQEL